MQKIFKNANLVDIENGSVELVDLYVENGIIKDKSYGKIERSLKLIRSN